MVELEFKPRSVSKKPLPGGRQCSPWAGQSLPPQTGSSPLPLPSDWPGGLCRVDSLSHQTGGSPGCTASPTRWDLGFPGVGQPLPSDWGSPEWTASLHQTEGFLTTRVGQFLPSFVPGLGGVGKPALHRPSTLPEPSLDTPHT